MDALLLAAGDGTRLNPLTKDKPKVMIKIHGLSILERSLHVLKNVGVKRVLIVIGYKGEVIRKFFGNEWNGLKIVYKETDWHGDGYLKSVIQGKGVINNRFIFLCGDTIPDGKYLKLALEKEGDMVLGIRNLKDDSVVAYVEKGIVKKTGTRSDMKFNVSVAGFSITEPVFFEAVEDCIKNDNFNRPDAINWLINKGYTVISIDIPNDSFLDIDNFEDLKKVKKIVLEKAVRERIENPGMFKKLFNFPISIPLTRLVVQTNITPNQITLTSLCLFIVAGTSFLLGYFIVGGIFCYLGAMLDAVDGKTSRLKFRGSMFGKFFDSVSDRISELSIVIGLTLGIYFLTQSYLIFLLGVFSIFFTVGRYYSQGLYYEFMNERIHVSKWKNSKLSKPLELANRDLTFFVVLVSCLLNYPVLGLGYMTFSASIAFFIRTFQTLKTLKIIEKPLVSINREGIY